MTRSSFAWDLPRNLTIKCSLFCAKFILKNLYLAVNSLYKKPIFLRETARGPGCLTAELPYSTYLPLCALRFFKKYWENLK